MTTENLNTRLRHLCIQAFGHITGGSQNIGDLIDDLEDACQMRQIVGPIQFEEMWESHLPENPKPHTFIQIKLSPIAFHYSKSFARGFNQFSWVFVLPNLSGLEPKDLPSNSVDYLLLGTIKILSKNSQTFTESGALEILDEYEAHANR